jgi:DNA invertase Pin-like site-specific DNA recombinase
VAATAQAQAEATKAAQRAGIEHAKQSGDHAYIARKPSYTRDQLNKVRDMLRQEWLDARGGAALNRTAACRQPVHGLARARHRRHHRPISEPNAHL